MYYWYNSLFHSLIIGIDSQDDCFYQCLVLLLFPRKEYILKGHFKRRIEKARELRGSNSIPVAFNEFDNLERQYDIAIFVINYFPLSFSRKSSSLSEKRLFLLYSEENGVGHFDFIIPEKIHCLWPRKTKFCFICYKAYVNQQHTCIPRCQACKDNYCAGINTERSDMNVLCRICNGRFFDSDCMKRHSNVCEKQKFRCENCNVIYRKKKKHSCNELYCVNCDIMYNEKEKHLCYMKALMPNSKEIKEPSTKYLYYDFESFLDNGVHTVAFAVVIYHESDEVFKFESVHEFMGFIFHERHMNYTAIAHNSGRYDYHFIKSEMIRKEINSNDIVNGHTFLSSYAPEYKIRFIDSFRFITMGLRAFPKTFGITELSKGHFPYRFLSKENVNYIGKMPSIEWFDFELLKGKDYTEAIAWHRAHEYDIINLKEMCLEYCVSDVTLLKAGCKKFRDIFMKISDDTIDPFQQITIASVCFKLFKLKFLKPNEIGIFNEIDSTDRLAFLKRMKMDFPNGIENTVVEGYNVDFQVDKDLYFFCLCIETGCLNCYNSFSQHPLKKIAMCDLRQLSFKKSAELKNAGYNVINYKECFAPKSSLFTKDLPLDMRLGFYGGRTEPVKMIAEAKEGYIIRYLDYTSLYPSINNGILRGITHETCNQSRIVEYPIGHPISITSNFGPLESYFGFISCDIAAFPNGPYLPVLPERKRGKLVFDNTAKTGIWTTVEIMKAIELGYKITKIHEILHFESKSDTIFRDYVKTFMKMKQEAAGWNNLGCISAEDCDEYIKRYKQNEDIDLDIRNIGQDKNAGMYFIAKLCLNSLWGKFGQRAEYLNHVDTFTQDDFEKYAHSDTYEVHNIFMHNNTARTVTYSETKIKKRKSCTNIAVAAFTTSHARLRLYEALEVLGEDIIYMDTDSVIFYEKIGEPKLVTGDFLGELTDELDGEDIVSFVTTGPKSYAYKTSSGKEVCKVKGMTLNYKTSNIINFDTLRKSITEGLEMKIQPLNFIIGQDHQIVTKDWGNDGKNFRYTSNKRKACELSADGNMDSIPF